MPQAADTVARIAAGSKSVVLADPLRCPKYTVTPRPRSCVCSMVSTSPRRAVTLSPVLELMPASAALAPNRPASASTSRTMSASASTLAGP